MKVQHKRAMLVIVLLLTLLLTIYVSKMDEVTPDVIGVREHNLISNISGKSTDMQESQVVNYTGRKISDPKQDIFQIQLKKEEKPVTHPKVSFKPPVIVLPPSVPSAVQPSVPPIPFKYLGKYLDQNGLVVFLNFYGKSLIVKSGDVIQQTYRIDEVKPPTLTMTYLPMDEKQIMNIGEIN